MRRSSSNLHRFLVVWALAAVAAGAFAQESASDSRRPATQATRSSRQRASTKPEARKSTPVATATPAPAAKSGATAPASAVVPSVAFDYHETSDSMVQVGYLLEPAGSWYEYKGGVLSWREPLPQETHLLAISVKLDGAACEVPNCKVTAGLADSAGKAVVTTMTLPFAWHPGGFRYSSNLAVPKDTTTPLTLNVKVDPPDFARFDKERGAVFAQSVGAHWKISNLPPGFAHDEKPPMAPERGKFDDGRHPPIDPTPYPGSQETTSTSR